MVAPLFTPKEKYYPNPTPYNPAELPRYIEEELHHISADLVVVEGPLPLPIRATDALLIGRGDALYTIDLWDYYFSLLAVAGLFDDPADFVAVNDVPQVIADWPSELSSFHFGTGVDALAGTITVPVAGIYSVTCKIIFQQQSVTQNFSYLLYINGSVGGLVIFDSLDINSNQTVWRSMGGSAMFAVADQEVLDLRLGTSAGATPGAADFQRCSFEVEMVAPDGAPPLP